MKNILLDLPKPFMVLAPMDDVTETVFRQIVASCVPPDLFFTEFVNVEALCSPGRESAMRRFVFADTERPIIAQIWGKNPDNFQKVASELAEMGFAGVDLNFGCPDKKVVRNGAGGGMIKYPDGAREIIQATKEGLDGKMPISVKTRIGLKEFDEEWIKFLLSQNLDMLTVHFRTVKEMSKVPARWSEFAEKIRILRDEISPKTLLVGNGDVLSRIQAEELAKKYCYDGIMIARGVFHDPYVFAPKSPWAELSPDEKIQLYIRHLRLFQQTYPGRERSFDTIKKFCKIYINNFAGAGELRVKLMEAKSVEESLNILQNHN